MNAVTQARSLYSQARSLKHPRDLEYELFARVTGRLGRARALTGPTAMPERIAALDENRRLWTVLAVDLAQPGNGLPSALRAQLAYLADYTLQTGDRILAGAPEGDALLASLVEINTIVMQGLRGEVAR